MRFLYYLNSLVFSLLIFKTMSFPAPLNSNIKTARIHLKIMKRNTSKNILKRIRVVSENQEEIVDKSVSIFYDNILTDMLGIAKVYNLVNDETKSYYYIILYEFAWFAFKVLKSNYTKIENQIDKDDSQLLFDQLIINVIMYVSIKNIIFQNVLNILNFST